MRTIQIKNIATNKVVAEYHFYSLDTAKKMALESFLPSGDYLIQGTNSSACKPRVSRKAWESAEKFTKP